MVRDEADIISQTVAHMLTQVDYVVVADNLSTDDSREMLHDTYREDPRVLLLDDDEPGYYQSLKMTHLSNVARREFGADWIVPFDADEYWYSPFGKIGDVLEGVAEQWLVVPTPIYNHMTTDLDNPEVLNPFDRIQWRMQEPLPMHKVACRWRDDLVIEQGNHGARYTGRATVFDSLLTIRHFPYRSAKQFIRKTRNGAEAYAAAGERLPQSYGAHWRQWGQLSDEQLEDVYRTWYHAPVPTACDPALIRDPVSNL